MCKDLIFFKKNILHDFSIFVPSTWLCTEFMSIEIHAIGHRFYMFEVFYFYPIFILPSLPEQSTVNVYI